jgi:UDP-N-acetylglucosamine 4-epimerase
MQAARDCQIRRFVYASSCAVYGDDAGSPKIEDRLGRSLSPYATTKRIDELYADVFSRCYGLPTIGLRYFNVYGSRQDPNGTYAAVIPKWMAAFSQGEAITIYGDGKTSRDFCFVQDVVQANILAATAPISGEVGAAVLNIGTGTETSLNELFAAMRDIVVQEKADSGQGEPIYKDFRPGDVRYSCADISSSRRLLGYAPAYDLRKGLTDLVAWDAAQEKPGIART